VSNLQKAEGLLDDFFVKNGAISITEIENRFQVQDEILTPDTLIFLGATVDLRSISPCATSINWTPVSSLSNATILNPLANPIVQTTYQVVFRYGSCQAKDSVTIKVIDKNLISCEEIRFPTAFSPNEDLLNDRFFISNNYIIQELEYFDIFDRNGAKVFSTSLPNDSWDGMFKNKRMNPGKYYYRVAYTCNDEKYNTRGAFFMLK
jgi:gliding motility-associated-like protein